jgi:hypothetical protein
MWWFEDGFGAHEFCNCVQLAFAKSLLEGQVQFCLQHSWTSNPPCVILPYTHTHTHENQLASHLLSCDQNSIGNQCEHQHPICEFGISNFLHKFH